MSNKWVDALDRIRQDQLSRATDRAIAEENRRALETTPEEEAKLDEEAERWRALLEAQTIAGEHGVVLPVALAREIISVLRGEKPNHSEYITPALLANTIEGKIKR